MGSICAAVSTFACDKARASPEVDVSVAEFGETADIGSLRERFQVKLYFRIMQPSKVFVKELIML